MDEKALKTTWGQRIAIILIALVMLGSTLAVYIAIVVNGGNSGENVEGNAKLTELQNQLTAKQDEITVASRALSDQYFNEFVQYKSQVRAYNAATANLDGLTITDLKIGDGETLTEGASNYLAYYIGWCPDESIFDSSFDSYENPTVLGTPIPGGNLIEGWNQGIIGMQLGGVREISIPGELAYGDTRDDICDGANTPLRFVVMALPMDETIKNLWNEIDDLSYQIQAIYFNL